MATVHCITCGYDLSAHAKAHKPGIVCPECGEPDAARQPPPSAKTAIVYLLAGLLSGALSLIPILIAGRLNGVLVVLSAPVLAGLALGFFLASMRYSPANAIRAFPIVGLLLAILLLSAMAAALTCPRLSVHPL